MDEELAIIQRAKDKISIDNRKKDVAILKQVLEPIEEGMGELSGSINSLMSFFEKVGTKNPEYYDKSLSANVISAIGKISELIKNFKQSEIKIDLSPIASIATEIKKGNDNILELLNKPNQSDEVVRMLTAMIGKQNISFEKWQKEIDYSDKLDALTQAIMSSDNRVQEINFKYNEAGIIKAAIPTYKNNK